MNEEKLGRVLGTKRGEVNQIAQWTLKENGKVVLRLFTRPLQVEEIQSAQDKKKRKCFGRLIEEI